MDNLARLREGSPTRLDFRQRENYLRSYYSIDLPEPDFMRTHAVGDELINQVRKVEEVHYEQSFRAERDALKNAKAGPEGLELRDRLQERINKTYCKLCKSSAVGAIKEFDNKQAALEMENLWENKEATVSGVEDRLFTFLKNKECLNSKFKAQQEEMPAHIRLLENRHKLTTMKLSQLEKLMTSGRRVKREKESLTSYIEDLESLSHEVELDYADLCEKMPGGCNCGE